MLGDIGEAGVGMWGEYMVDFMHAWKSQNKKNTIFFLKKWDYHETRQLFQLMQDGFISKVSYN